MRYDIIDPIPDDLYHEAEGWLGYTIYHTKAWHQVLKSTFDWQVKALVAYDDNQSRVAYLPFIKKRRLLSTINVALPLSHHVGFARKSDNAIVSQPPDITLEIHAPSQWENTIQQNSYVVTTLKLSDYDNTELLFKALHKNSIQRKIKKAMKSDFEVITDITTIHLNDFTRLQALTRQRQGSPTFPSSFFHNMAAALQSNLKMFMAYHEENAIAGAVFLCDKGRAIYGYGASLPDTDLIRLGANQLVMWEGLKAAFDQGLSLVDFGITPVGHDSLRLYKEKWAGSSEPLPYTYFGLTDGIKRESSPVKLVSNFLQHIPFPLFRTFSPLLLREVV